MLRFLLRCGLFLAIAGYSFASQRVAATQSLGGPQAECTFTVEIVDRILAAVPFGEEYQSIETLLSEHECEHGWGLDSWDPDYVDAAHAVSCSEAVLERMNDLKVGNEDYVMADLFEHFATALQRAGRIEDALKILDSAIIEGSSPSRMPDCIDSLRLREHAVTLMERAGRSEGALERVKALTCGVRCGSYSQNERDAIGRHLSFLTTGSQRCDVAREWLVSELFHGEPKMMCLWIGCEIRSGRAIDSKTALRELRRVTDAGERMTRACEAGKRLWDLQHADRATRLGNLGELATLDPDSAMPLVFSMSEAELLPLGSAFDVVDEHCMRNKSLAGILAATGHPAFQAPMERAAEKVGATKLLLRRWQDAHRRWTLVREKRR